ncbi:uncharacterized protein VICG_02003 [Vittaforma corneae ATCC 50505]|uniref:serine C-palmitoyltransferase n=1 Tax=Vittaforma corneae (strain ATCC 50505) TaxID=993615 RepID=L2GJB6_VITCO|nr:uncharacterized protein VICG_02003 [Vittaforma corneae ATCC 50505]ELA40973.1 hypothetical protein VICG_02003 [Vittaforma corneae ATCC 50505]
MDYLFWIFYLYDRKISIGVQFILTFLTYLLVKYRYRQPSTYLVLKKSTKERLIKAFNPEPLILDSVTPYKFKTVKYNFSNHDVFNLGRKFKDEIKATIREYGVGTCGPRGFYGTLDIHLDLEKKISELFGKDAAIIYSNYFTCVQSVISCFCRARNNVFVHTKAFNAIHSGVLLSRANKHTYDTLEDLKHKLDTDLTDKYLIVERIGWNTGEMVDLNTIVDLKKRYGFRIILDEACSIPFVYQKPEDQDLYSQIDLIIGSLSLGYPTNGGFCATCREAVDYQRLSGSAYVFSASLPAFLSKAALCMLAETLDYRRIREKIKKAQELIPGIVSTSKSPILLIKCDDLYEKHNQLREEGYVIGMCGEYLRICINEECDEKDLKAVGDILIRNK